MSMNTVTTLYPINTLYTQVIRVICVCVCVCVCVYVYVYVILVLVIVRSLEVSPT